MRSPQGSPYSWLASPTMILLISAGNEKTKKKPDRLISVPRVFFSTNVVVKYKLEGKNLEEMKFQILIKDNKN